MFNADYGQSMPATHDCTEEDWNLDGEALVEI